MCRSRQNTLKQFFQDHPIFFAVLRWIAFLPAGILALFLSRFFLRLLNGRYFGELLEVLNTSIGLGGFWIRLPIFILYEDALVNACAMFCFLAVAPKGRPLIAGAIIAFSVIIFGIIWFGLLTSYEFMFPLDARVRMATHTISSLIGMGFGVYLVSNWVGDSMGKMVFSIDQAFDQYASDDSNAWNSLLLGDLRKKISEVQKDRVENNRGFLAVQKRLLRESLYFRGSGISTME